MGLDALLENQLGHWPKFQQLHIRSISTQRGWSWPYFSSMGSGFWDTGRFSKLPYLAMKLAIGQSSKRWPYTVSTGSKLSLFLLYGHQFLGYGPILKIAIFGHETCSLAKVPEVSHIHFLPQGEGRNWAYFLSMDSGFRYTGDFSKLPYLGMTLGQNMHIKFQIPPGGGGKLN